MNLQDIVKQRVVVLDGAMGTMIQRYRLDENDFRGTRFADAATEMKGNNDMLNITCQHVVEDIHRKYLSVGYLNPTTIWRTAHARWRMKEQG